MTLTIKLPEDIAAGLDGFSEDEKVQFTVNALRDVLAQQNTFSNEELAEIDAGAKRGEDDFANGRYRRLDAVIKDKAERFGIKV